MTAAAFPMIRFRLFHLRFAFAALLVSAMLACGGGQEGLKEKKPLEDISTRDLAESSKLIGKAQLICASGTLGFECHPAVAMMAVALPQVVQVYTAVLVADNLVLTAASSLPQELRRNGQVCRDRIQFAFASESPKTALSVGCDRIIEVSDPWDRQTRVGVDTALIRLSSPVKRQPVALNDQGGLSDGDLASSFRIVQEGAASNQSLKAQLERMTCTARTGSVALISFQSSQSPNAMVSDCKFHKTQAGAPLFSSSGVLQAILQSEMTQAEAQGAFGTLLVSGKAPRAMIYASQMGCAALSSITPRRLSATCTQVEPYRPSDEQVKVAFNRMDQASQERARLDVVQFWSKNLPNLEQVFRWRPRLLPADVLRVAQTGGSIGSVQDNVYFPYPECFQDENLWKRKGRFRTFMDIFMKTTYSEGPFDLPRWIFRLRLDEYLRPMPEILGAIGNVQAKIEFSPSRAKRSGSSDVTMKVVLANGSEVTVATESVSTCVK